MKKMILILSALGISLFGVNANELSSELQSIHKQNECRSLSELNDLGLDTQIINLNDGAKLNLIPCDLSAKLYLYIGVVESNSGLKVIESKGSSILANPEFNSRFNRLVLTEGLFDGMAACSEIHFSTNNSYTVEGFNSRTGSCL